MTRFGELANQVNVAANPAFADLTVFANTYLDVFNTGFHYAFAASIVALLISMTIYITNRVKFPDPAAKKTAAGAGAIEMDKDEIRQRLYALFAVYAIVIFF
jgi:POT family proton-dependent oligopeptide transporter